MEAIDIHAHILPGTDDGARDRNESRAMLLSAYSQGIRRIIATPHYSGRRGSEGIIQLTEELNVIAREINPDFAVFPGQEIFYFDGLADALKEGRVLTLASSRYVLVEFSPGVAYQALYQGIRRITMARFIPVLAHVERYRCLHEKRDFKAAVRCDCRFQMNYDSLAGPFWDPGVKWCRKQVAEGNIHLLATDMHRIDYRKPDLAKPVAWLSKHVDEKKIKAMVWDNPNAIIKNERME